VWFQLASYAFLLIHAEVTLTEIGCNCNICAD